MGAGLPVPSFNLLCMDCDDVRQTSCKVFCFENEVASFGDISEDALEDEDWACEVVINNGCDVTEEEGGVFGRRGEYLGETLEWGDDGALVE